MFNYHFSCRSEQHEFSRRAQENNMVFSTSALAWQEHRLRSLPASSFPQTREYFRFLDLPLELRTMIYKLVVSNSPNRSTYTGMFASYMFVPDSPRMRLSSLCQTNRQIRSEAMPIYFKSKHICLWVHDMPSLYALLRWLDMGMYNRKAAMIQRLELQVGSVLFIEFGLGGSGIYASNMMFHQAKIGIEDDRILDNEASIRPGIQSVFNTMEAATPADSGLRVHHIARILRLIYDDDKDLTNALRLKINELCVPHGLA